MEILLDSAQEKFLQSEIAAGNFRAPAEVISAGLSLLEQQRRDLLVDIDAGLKDLESGKVVSMDEARARVREALGKR